MVKGHRSSKANRRATDSRLVDGERRMSSRGSSRDVLLTLTHFLPRVPKWRQ